MTTKARSFWQKTALLGVSPLAVAIFIWDGSSRITKIEDRQSNNTESIKEIKQDNISHAKEDQCNKEAFTKTLNDVSTQVQIMNVKIDDMNGYKYSRYTTDSIEHIKKNR